MYAILYSVKFQSALVYKDEIIVFSEIVKQHQNYFQHVLVLLLNAGVKSKLKKFSVFAAAANHVSHVIRGGKPEIAESTTDAT